MRARAGRADEKLIAANRAAIVLPDGHGLVSTEVRALNNWIREGGNFSLAAWKLWIASPLCFKLFPHCIRRAASRALCTAGSRRPTSVPMIAITTNSSTSVKADFERTGGMIRPPEARERGTDTEARRIAITADASGGLPP